MSAIDCPKIQKQSFTRVTDFQSLTDEDAFKVKIVLRKVFIVKGDKAFDKRGTMEIALYPTLEEFHKIFKSQLVHALKYLMFVKSDQLDVRANFIDLTHKDTSNHQWKKDFNKKIMFKKVYLNIDDIKNDRPISESELNDRFNKETLEPMNVSKKFYVVVHWPDIPSLENVEHWYEIVLSDK